MRINNIKSRLTLILLGIGLGYLARIVLGAPAEDTGPPRKIERPLELNADEVIDLPILKPASAENEDSGLESGLVPPIRLPGSFALKASGRMDASFPGSRLNEVSFDDFSHGSAAAFEAHGEQLCASGCAVSRHPTARLTKSKFNRLIRGYSEGPMDETNKSLEELVYFGAQSRKFIDSQGVDELDRERARFLWDQLASTHARFSIRVTDDQGVVRTWIEPTRVPFDRRHVFEMKTNDVQPLVTSGTAKRVGLNHIWARL